MPGHSLLYSWSFSLVSSIVISRNSLDSKMSPQSMQTTNSASSSRETTCTRGCLQSFGEVLLAGGWGGGMGVIKLTTAPELRLPGDSSELGVF